MKSASYASTSFPQRRRKTLADLQKVLVHVMATGTTPLCSDMNPPKRSRSPTQAPSPLRVANEGTIFGMMFSTAKAFVLDLAVKFDSGFIG